MSDAKAVSKSTLVQGAFALFFFSFLMSGCANALPQVFFQQHYPDRKTLLLSIALLSSTVAAVAGVLLSRRVHLRRAGAAIAILVTTALAGVLVSTGTAALFLACLVLLQFANNFLLNRIDHVAADAAGEQRGFQDGAGNAARLLGMLCAPTFFTELAGYGLAEWLVIVLLGGAAMASSMRLFLLRPPLPDADRQVTQNVQAPSPADLLVFSYAIAVYAALYIFAANMIYLLRDHFQLAGAETRGGAVIVMVFLSALAANGAVAATKRGAAPDADGESRFTAALALPAVGMVFAAGVVLAGVQASYGFCLAAACVIGASYGVFLWVLRDYASRAVKRGKTVLLSWFNNLANVSSLFAFGLMLVLSLTHDHVPSGYYTWLMWATICMLTVGLALLFRAAKLKLQAKT